ncbi:MAG: sulfatase-like hydrolase/transferase [Thermoanaerobaculia bacterium]|nr:sulfatase-like hydrolase/transferase [Thermoanaerobaculia bacterium]
MAGFVFSGCSGPKEELGGAHASETTRRLNVVILSLDTLRADHLGLYGYSRNTSPNLDALAEKSVVFDLAIAQSSHTDPSHKALFQSRYVSHVSNETPMLAETLRHAGFTTAAFTGAGKMSAQLGFDRGFDSFVEEFGGFRRTFSDVEAWLRDPPEAPFFLFIHTYDVHLPYDPPPPFDTMYFPEYEGPLDGTNSKAAIHRYMGLNQFKGFADRTGLTESDKLKIVGLYDGGIRYTDRYVGKLIEVLKAEGLWDRTIFVVLADHGEEFLEHGSFLHGLTLFQETVRVPLIFRFPLDNLAGLRVPEPVALIDVKPTILELLRISPGHELQGRSLVPRMKGASLESAPILSEIDRARFVLRFPWKVLRVRRGPGDFVYQLFNLETDPEEVVDLAEDYPDLVDQLVSEMTEIIAQKPKAEIKNVNTIDFADEELRRQLEALGYVDTQ